MFEVSFYTAEGTYTFPLSPQVTSWEKAKRAARFILHESLGAPESSSVKDVTIWLYKKGKLFECRTFFGVFGGDRNA